MKRFLIRAAAAAGLLALGAGLPAASLADTSPAAKPARQCFWPRMVSNFAAANDRTVYLRVGVRDVYELQMLGACPDVDWANKIAIQSRGSSQVCTGLDADIIAPTAIGPQRCAVRTLRKLSPEEVAVLPKRAKP